MTATRKPKISVTEWSEWTGALFRQAERASAGCRGGPARLLGGERTKTRDRTESLLAVHLLYHLVVVPRVLGFLRRLDLHHVHVVDHHAVRADIPALGEHVVDLHFFQFCHDFVGISSPGGLDSLEVVHRGRVVSGLVHGRLPTHFRKVAPAERAGLLV